MVSMHDCKGELLWQCVRDFKLTTAELLMRNHVSSRWQGEAARWFTEKCEGACGVSDAVGA